MDRVELRLKMLQELLAQHRHEVALRHSDLQRRFVLALGAAGAILLAALRSEFPPWFGMLAFLPLAWAWRGARRIEAVVREDTDRARSLLDGFRRSLVSEGSSSVEEDGS